jgi:hypothetical protein
MVQRMRNWKAVSVAVVVVTVLAWQLSAEALTNDGLRPTGNYDPGDCSKGGPGNGEVCQTDNATVTYYMDSGGAYELEAPDRTAVQTAIANVYQPTQFSVSYQSPVVTSGSAETDWFFEEGDPGSGFVGYTWCDDPVGGDKCDQHYVRIRGNGAYTAPQVCHEAGHAAGLVHGDSVSPDTVSNSNATVMGCLVVGQGGGPGVLRQFQIDDIASTY